MMKETKATRAAVLKPSLNKYASLDDLDSINSSLRTAGRPYSPNAPSHNRKRNLSADFPLWHHNESWDPVGAWGLQKKRHYSSFADSADQGSRSPLWTPGLATVGRLKETQKKRRYSSSTDSTDQGSQSPSLGIWLSNSGQTEGNNLCCFRGKSPPVLTHSQMSPANSSFIYERLSREQGIEYIIKDKSTGALYFKVKPSAIPPGWSNDPDELSLDYYFNGVEANMRVPFQSQLGMPNPVPVAVNRNDGLWLIDSGDWEVLFLGGCCGFHIRNL